MTEQKPMSTTNQPGIVPGQTQAQAPAQANPTPNFDSEKAAKQAAEAKAAYDAAVEKMTDRDIYSRIVAAHARAADSLEGVKAMEADYGRLVAERDAAKAAAKPA